MLPEELNVRLCGHSCGSGELELSGFWIFELFFIIPDNPEFCYIKPNTKWSQTSCNYVSGHSTKWMNKSCLFLCLSTIMMILCVYTECNSLFIWLQLDKWQCHCLLTVKLIMYTKVKEIIQMSTLMKCILYNIICHYPILVFCPPDSSFCHNSSFILDISFAVFCTLAVLCRLCGFSLYQQWQSCQP